MGNGAIDYLSFVRGFVAATNHDVPGTAGEPGPGVDPASFAAGVAAGSGPVEYTVSYRELSLQDGGRFSGTLDLPAEEPESAGPALSGVLDFQS